MFADSANGDYHLKSEKGRWDPRADGGAGAWVKDNVTSPGTIQGEEVGFYHGTSQASK